MDRLIPIVDNEWYHVYNRGNDRRTLFLDAQDYHSFRTKMEAASARYHIQRIAYVLMPNHFHAIVMQKQGGDLSRMMMALGTSYARRYNLRHHHTGHVLQGRYHYTHIPNEDALFKVAAYIHMNPVRAGLASRPDDWEFSDFGEIRDQGVLQPGVSSGEGRFEPGRLEPGLALLSTRRYIDFIREATLDLENVRRFLFESETDCAKASKTKASFNLE